jgi:hypothetical protein
VSSTTFSFCGRSALKEMASGDMVNIPGPRLCCAKNAKTRVQLNFDRARFRARKLISRWVHSLDTVASSRPALGAIVIPGPFFPMLKRCYTSHQPGQS